MPLQQELLSALMSLEDDCDNCCSLHRPCIMVAKETGGKGNCQLYKTQIMYQLHSQYWAHSLCPWHRCHQHSMLRQAQAATSLFGGTNLYQGGIVDLGRLCRFMPFKIGYTHCITASLALFLITTRHAKFL